MCNFELPLWEIGFQDFRTSGQVLKIKVMLPQIILFCCLRCSLNHREYNLIDEKLIKALFFHFLEKDIVISLMLLIQSLIWRHVLARWASFVVILISSEHILSFSSLLRELNSYNALSNMKLQIPFSLQPMGIWPSSMSGGVVNRISFNSQDTWNSLIWDLRQWSQGKQ